MPKDDGRLPPHRERRSLFRRRAAAGPKHADQEAQSLREFGVGASSTISDDKDNVHWFQALDTISISPRVSASTYSAEPG